MSEAQVLWLLEARLGILYLGGAWRMGTKRPWHVDARSVVSCEPGRVLASRHAHTCLCCCKCTYTLLCSMLSASDAT